MLEQEGQQPEDVEERGQEGAACAEADAEADVPLEPAADEPPLAGEAADDAEEDAPGADGSAVAPVDGEEAELDAA